VTLVDLGSGVTAELFSSARAQPAGAIITGPAAAACTTREPTRPCPSCGTRSHRDRWARVAKSGRLQCPECGKRHLERNVPVVFLCSGVISWDGHDPDKDWSLKSLDPLHVEPSVNCACQGLHGWIRDGRWVPV
jgi:hypothetical protein